MLLPFVTSSVLSFIRSDTPCFAESKHASSSGQRLIHAPPACGSYQQRCVMSTTPWSVIAINSSPRPLSYSLRRPWEQPCRRTHTRRSRYSTHKSPMATSPRPLYYSLRRPWEQPCRRTHTRRSRYSTHKSPMATSPRPLYYSLRRPWEQPCRRTHTRRSRYSTHKSPMATSPRPLYHSRLPTHHTGSLEQRWWRHQQQQSHNDTLP